jgi:hypothetical protein
MSFVSIQSPHFETQILMSFVKWLIDYKSFKTRVACTESLTQLGSKLRDDKLVMRTAFIINGSGKPVSTISSRGPNLRRNIVRYSKLGPGSFIK